MIKNKRGQKLCKQCGTISGARAFECKKCGTQFAMKKFKKTKRKVLVSDYKTLQRGDTIRVISGSGPFYQDGDGERIYLTDRGKYTVMSTDDNGICAYGENGYEYIYMGITCKSNILDNITKAPCKILLVKTMSQPN